MFGKDEQIANMQALIDQLEKQQLKHCVKIKNVPQKQNEDLLEIMKSLGKTINHNITNTDITDLYRTRTKNIENSRIRATFQSYSYTCKTEFMQKACPLTIVKLNQHMEDAAKIREIHNNNTTVTPFNIRANITKD